MSWLGVDIGTSSCKAVCFDDRGQAIAEGKCSYELQRPENGAAMIDARELRSAWRTAIAEAVAGCPQDPPRGLSISSQGEAVMLLDASNEPLAAVLTSLDSRPLAAIAGLLAQHDADWYYQRSGHTLHPMFSIAKLAWSRQDDAWSRVARVHCLEDALQRDLGVAEPAMSFSLAGRTMLFDVQEKCWNDELCASIDLDPALLPRCLPSGSIAGYVEENNCGLAPGIPVVCGGHDQGMGALGAGVSKAGEAMYATGSIECICPALGALRLSPQLREANLCSYDFTIPGLSTTVAFSLTGGNALQWFRDQFARELPANGAGLDSLLAEMPAPPSALLSLPYLAPSGTPYFHPRPMGALLGLDMAMDRGEILKGLMEGIALEMRLNCQVLADNGLTINRFLATGGAARSPISTQLKADVLGAPVAALSVDEAGCLGGAMLAAAGSQNIDICEAQACMKPTACDIEPDAERASIYDERFARYQGLFDGVRELMS